MVPGITPTLEPPYYAVIFTSQRSELEPAEYEAAAERMLELAKAQAGFLGVDTVRDANGLGITVSYWRTAEDVVAWRRNAEHTATRERGRSTWYRHWQLRVARVERESGADAPE